MPNDLDTAPRDEQDTSTAQLKDYPRVGIESGTRLDELKTTYKIRKIASRLNATLAARRQTVSHIEDLDSRIQFDDPTKSHYPSGTFESETSRIPPYKAFRLTKHLRADTDVRLKAVWKHHSKHFEGTREHLKPSIVASPPRSASTEEKGISKFRNSRDMKNGHVRITKHLSMPEAGKGLEDEMEVPHGRNRTPKMGITDDT